MSFESVIVGTEWSQIGLDDTIYSETFLGGRGTVDLCEASNPICRLLYVIIGWSSLLAFSEMLMEWH